jgi:hypothetical protein
VPYRQKASRVIAAEIVADADHKDACVSPGRVQRLPSRSTCSFRKCVAQEMQGS